jgi:hypothetical protein
VNSFTIENIAFQVQLERPTSRGRVPRFHNPLLAQGKHWHTLSSPDRVRRKVRTTGMTQRNRSGDELRRFVALEVSSDASLVRRFPGLQWAAWVLSHESGHYCYCQVEIPEKKCSCGWMMGNPGEQLAILRERCCDACFVRNPMFSCLDICHMSYTCVENFRHPSEILPFVSNPLRAVSRC